MCFRQPFRRILEICVSMAKGSTLEDLQHSAQTAFKTHFGDLGGVKNGQRQHSWRPELGAS